ncbi:MAG: 2-polyprenylphenol 6-hydroxylase [Rhodospirillales bacterium]|nr:2-polyprenylphenol 6-hydroxylase [Rhodospirillales bacterium]
MISGLRNAGRLLLLARLLARHDALFVLERFAVGRLLLWVTRPLARRAAANQPALRPGQRLALALQDAGPSFVKFGQALASRSDLLGEELARDLASLQDRLPPFPFAQVRVTIEEEFGQPLEKMFRSFEQQPVAAASIAQVHFAIDTEGREVAVKVLRPGIEKAFARDLELFFWIGRNAEANLRTLRRLRLLESLETLAKTVVVEMDLRFEAAAACELADNFRGDRSFFVPAVDWTRTGRRVLTTERVAGLRIDERAAVIAAGHDPRAVLTKAAEAFFFQVFRDGFFHGDLHAGNLFVRADGSVAAVDFGIMGRIDRSTRRHLGEMLLAFLTRNWRRAAEVHFEAGWVPSDHSLDAFAQACRSIAEPIMDKPQNEISVARLLGQLFQVTETFAMETQPQLLLLQKTMLVAEGTGRTLAPEANMWLLARPLIESWCAETLGPQARMREAATDVAAALSRLPALVRRAEHGFATLAEGRLKIDAENLRQAHGPMNGTYAGWLAAALLAGIVIGMLAG